MKLSWKFISVACNLSPPFLKLQTKTCHESVSVKSRAERVGILLHCIALHRILSSGQLSSSPSSQPSSSTLRNCYRRRYVVENFGLTWCAFEVKRYLLFSSLLHFISQLLFSWFPSFSSILLWLKLFPFHVTNEYFHFLIHVMTNLSKTVNSFGSFPLFTESWPLYSAHWSRSAVKVLLWFISEISEYCHKEPGCLNLEFKGGIQL